MKYGFHPEAEAELLAAIDYYEGCEPGPGYDFALEVHSTIENILSFPSAWAVVLERPRLPKREMDEKNCLCLIARPPFLRRFLMLKRTTIHSCALLLVLAFAAVTPARSAMTEYDMPEGSRPHDVAPAADGGIWYTAQRLGALGYLNPESGETRHFSLGRESAPHGVIVGTDGSPWITDGGLNAIVRVDAGTGEVTSFPLPDKTPWVNLNTATFDKQEQLWFTGQAGYYGRVLLKTGKVEIFAAPRGPGPYGICTTPDGDVYYASLAGNHIARIDTVSGKATVIEPPTPDQGARRVWSDSSGRIWVSEWNAGQLALYDPASGGWREWKLPGTKSRPYAVYVDEQDIVWLSDFGNNSLVRFEPATETFTVFTLPSRNANIRQILGRRGEIWGGESGADKLVVLHSPQSVRKQKN
jgi:virginiamycin B lyase